MGVLLSLRETNLSPTLMAACGCAVRNDGERHSRRRCPLSDAIRVMTIDLHALPSADARQGHLQELRMLNATPLQPWTEDRALFLDRSYDELVSTADCGEAMERLSGGLWWYRRADPSGWRSWVQEWALRHPLRDLLHNDPFTHRSYSKPRGFAGDAKMIDLVYFDQGWANLVGVSNLGRRLYWRNRASPGPKAVRERRDHMAAMLDRVALRKPGAAVMSIAAGHMREALISKAVLAGTFREIVAFDQDKEALAAIPAAMGERVKCVHGNIRSIADGEWHGQRYDFIYAAGLYDYLPASRATRLTARLFDLLDEGGELLVVNFMPDTYDAGYMESFMDWTLVCRTPDQLFALSEALPPSARSAASIYFLGAPELVYMKLTRG